ncbi:MAG TPA: hypothetical protein PKZ37_15020 [Gallionellaceae bacterium]|nr:hypothetical protein [Gallionellaceae bacterium]
MRTSDQKDFPCAMHGFTRGTRFDPRHPRLDLAALHAIGGNRTIMEWMASVDGRATMQH